MDRGYFRIGCGEDTGHEEEEEESGDQEHYKVLLFMICTSLHKLLR
jgi:hypothetical protein